MPTPQEKQKLKDAALVECNKKVGAAYDECEKKTAPAYEERTKKLDAADADPGSTALYLWMVFVAILLEATHFLSASKISLFSALDVPSPKPPKPKKNATRTQPGAKARQLT